MSFLTPLIWMTQSHPGNDLLGPANCSSPTVQAMVPSVTAPVSSLPMSSTTQVRHAVSNARDILTSPPREVEPLGVASRAEGQFTDCPRKGFGKLFWMHMLHQCTACKTVGSSSVWCSDFYTHSLVLFLRCLSFSRAFWILASLQPQ